ncbi:hypothetical protein [Metabacillus sp. SLBN-84]
MELDNAEKRNRPVSSEGQKRIRRKKPVLLFAAEPFWPRSWAMELDNTKSGAERSGLAVR